MHEPVANALKAIAADVRGGCAFKSVWGFIHKRAYEVDALGEVFAAVREAAACSHQEYLSAVLDTYRKRNDREGLATLFDHAAGGVLSPTEAK